MKTITLTLPDAQYDEVASELSGDAETPTVTVEQMLLDHVGGFISAAKRNAVVARLASGINAKELIVTQANLDLAVIKKKRSDDITQADVDAIADIETISVSVV